MSRLLIAVVLISLLVACGGGEPAPDPEAALAAMNRGLAALEAFEYEDARREFTAAHEAMPDWLAAKVNLSIALLNIRGAAHDQALEICDGILAEDPDQRNALFISAVLLRIRGETEDGLRRFDRLVSADPADAASHFWRALSLIDLERNEDAIEALDRAIAADPHLAAAIYQKSQRLRRAGDDRQAEELQEIASLLMNPPPGKEFPIIGNELTGKAYHEIGKYALAIRDFAEFPREPMASPAGFETTDGGALAAYRYGNVPGAEFGLIAKTEGEAGTAIVLRAAGLIGPGVVLGDFDGDGDTDAFLPQWDGVGVLFANDGRGIFTDVTVKAGLGTRCRGIAGTFFDADGDADLDLYVTCAGPNVFYRNRGDGTFADETLAAGLGGGELVSLGAVAGDLDHEGDVDLLVLNWCRTDDGEVSGAPDRLFQNNRDGTFTDVAADAIVSGGNRRSVGALTLDVDGDLDTDLLVIRDRGPAALYLNDRMWRYREAPLPPELRTTEPAWGATAADLDRDGKREIVVFRGPAVNATVLEVREGGSLVAVGGPLTKARWRTGVLLDADLDGWVDLVGDDVVVLGRDGVPIAPIEKTAGAVPAEARGIGFGDFDGDGDLDRLVAGRSGAQLILTQAPAGNHWIALDMIGREALQPAAWAAKVGPGQELEIRAGRLWQPLRARASTGFLSTIEKPARFGLGTATKADIVRIIWPDRVLQVEAEVSADQVKRVEEVNRKPDSCPMLFVWDGTDFRFVSDFLGVGGLGFFAAPGVFGSPDPDEYLLIGEWVVPKDGDIVLQVTEPLEEISFLDETTLVVVDHPAGWAVAPNERYVGEPRLFPKPRIWAAPERVFPKAATDIHGNDVRGALARVDRIYAPVVADRRFTGLAMEHATVLDFTGRVPETDGRLVLFLDGWIEYGYSHTVFAAFQAGMEHMMPRIEVPDGKGGWKTVMENMGVPAGLNKTMTVDVTGIVTKESPVIRIRTNLEVFWDRITLGADKAAGNVVVTRIAPRVAHLHDRGYPREYSPDGRLPLVYDYAVMDPGYPYKNMTGDYTRFGDVLPLVTKTDDMYVIMGRGEELTLRYDAAKLPALPEGWSRTYILHAVGWCKDMDPYTHAGDTVEPLPFRAMSGYPYGDGESYPDDPEHRRYRAEWNTRKVYGR